MVKTYPNTELYLDNDRTGNEVTETLNRRFPEAEKIVDCFTEISKDLNEFLMNDSLRKRDTGKEDDNLLLNRLVASFGALLELSGSASFCLFLSPPVIPLSD